MTHPLPPSSRAPGTINPSGDMDLVANFLAAVTSVPAGSGTPAARWNPQQYAGAKGDGATDDTTAINNTLAAMSAGDVIDLSTAASSYLISAPLIVPSGVVIKGKAAGIPPAKTRSAATPTLPDITTKSGAAISAMVTDGAWTSAATPPVPSSGILIDGLVLDGTNIASGDGHGIALLSQAASVINCAVQNVPGIGILMTNTSLAGHATEASPTQMTQDECGVYNCRIASPGVSGIVVDYTTPGGTITDGYVKDNIIDMDFGGTGVAMVVQNMADWQVTGNHVYAAPLGAYQLLDCSQATIADNRADNWGQNSVSATTYIGFAVTVAPFGRTTIRGNRCYTKEAAGGGAGNFLYYQVGPTGTGQTNEIMFSDNSCRQVLAGTSGTSVGYSFSSGSGGTLTVLGVGSPLTVDVGTSGTALSAVPTISGTIIFPPAFSILNYGAHTDGATDSTAAIQACMAAAAAAGGTVLIPAGIQFRVSQLTWVAGTVLQGVYSGTFPGDDTITTNSMLVRGASTNQNLIEIPDGTNYGGIYDLSIDGNKSQNTGGTGIHIADGASGQECQIRIERCFIHDNPGDNIYLGNNRRATHITNSIFNQSGSGSGIVVAGSDNKIINCIMGSNAQAGIQLGTGTTQNWAARGTVWASDVTLVYGCDIFLNDVGVAIAQSAVQAAIISNGIDRNNLQGITVYDGDTHQLIGNLLHTNGTTTNNTYAHIDVGAGVTQVGIASNTFGPIDGGFSNYASYAVNYASTAGAIGAILGNIGVIDSTSTVGGLISPVASASPPMVVMSKTGVTVQGNSGEDILRLVRSGGSVVLKITQNGTAVWSGDFQLTEQGSGPSAVSGAGIVYVDASGNLNYLNPSGAGSLDAILGPYFQLPELSGAPSTPTGGGILYVDATGHLHYLGPGGTNTILAGP